MPVFNEENQTIIPESPSVLPGEQLYLYVPVVTKDTPGIASFDDNNFNVSGGKVALKEDYLDNFVKIKLNDLSLRLLDNDEYKIELGYTDEKNTYHTIGTLDANIGLLLSKMIGSVSVTRNTLTDIYTLKIQRDVNAPGTGNAIIASTTFSLPPDLERAESVDKKLSDLENDLENDFEDAINSALNLIRLDYNKDTGMLTLNMGEEIEPQKVDLPLESAIVKIDDSLGDDGTRYLNFYLTKAPTTVAFSVPLDEIFEGFVKSQENYFHKYKLYGLDGEGKDYLYLTDKGFYGSDTEFSNITFEDQIVFRRVSGDIFLPRVSTVDTSAARVDQVKAVEASRVPIDPSTTHKDGTVDDYIELEEGFNGLEEGFLYGVTRTSSNGGIVLAKIPFDYNTTHIEDIQNSDKNDGLAHYSIVQRDGNSDVLVPENPTSEKAAASKSYVKREIDALAQEARYRLDQLESATHRHADISSFAYETPVPEGAGNYAFIGKIGGRTYRSENKLMFPYPSTTKVHSGVTVTVNADRSITFNGKPHEAVYFILYEGPQINNSTLFTGVTLPDDMIYYRYYSGEFGEERYETFGGKGGSSLYLDEFDKLCIYIPQDAVLDNFTIYPMLVDGTTEKPYVPAGIVETKVTQLKSSGANFVTPPTGGYVVNNVTFTPLDDGTIHVKGSASALATYKYKDNGAASIKLLGGNTYYLSGNPFEETGTAGIRLRSTDSGNQSVIVTNNEQKSFTTKKYGEYNIEIHVYKGCTVDAIFKPMVSTVRRPYTPYGFSATFQIPEALIDFLETYGYGRGLDEHFNYIDFERKVFVQRTYRITCDGTENWLASSTSETGKYRNRLPFSNDEQGNSLIPVLPKSNKDVGSVICNYYQSISADNVYLMTTGIAITDDNAVALYDEAYNTDAIDLWKDHLAERYKDGNPLIFEYALEEPIEIDISAFISDDISLAVEAGGTITVENTYKEAVPLTMEYVITKGD